MPAFTRRAPHVVNLLCVSVAGAIVFMPFDSTASKECDDEAACLESSATSPATASHAATAHAATPRAVASPAAASPTVASLAGDTDDSGYPIGLVQLSLGACALAGFGSVLLSRRAVGPKTPAPA
jgi:hypothetical protein